MVDPKQDRITRNELTIISSATANSRSEGTFTFSSVGLIREEDLDGLFKSVDLLLNVEGCETALVFGVADSKALVGVLRTTSSTVEPKSWIESIFSGLEVEAIGEDVNKVEFSIPLGLFGSTRDKTALWGLVKRTVEDLFLDKIGRAIEKD